MGGKAKVPPAERSVRESEIFPEPPGSGNYTSSIGVAVGIELFQGRGGAPLSDSDIAAVAAYVGRADRNRKR
jgi:hypothetical protein